jgi:hypothetical protein
MSKVLLLMTICCGFLLAASAQNVIDPRNRIIDTTGQQDLIGIAKSIFNIKSKHLKSEDGKQVYFSFLPVSTSVPGGGAALITSTTAGFYMGPRSNTYLSNVTFTPYLNFKGRFGLPLRSSIWLTNNSWNIQGDTRMLVYPQYTWGLGGNQMESNKMLVNYKYIRFYQSALKRITSYFFAGIGYNLDYHIDIEADDASKLESFTHYQYGAAQDNNSFSSGPSINLLYDTRNNAFNPMPGCYANIVYRYNAKIMGSNNYWQSLYVDLRKYISLGGDTRKNVLALWSYYWTTLTSGTPYLDLPSIGWDLYNRSGRGIEQNRYRGQELLYLESEYRRDITRNGLLGFVVFANANSVTEAAGRNFKYINPAAGAGLRIKFNKSSATNIAIDYGFSKYYHALSLNLGEAF